MTNNGASVDWKDRSPVPTEPVVWRGIEPSFP